VDLRSRTVALTDPWRRALGAPTARGKRGASRLCCRRRASNTTMSDRSPAGCRRTILGPPEAAHPLRVLTTKSKPGAPHTHQGPHLATPVTRQGIHVSMKKTPRREPTKLLVRGPPRRPPWSILSFNGTHQSNGLATTEGGKGGVISDSDEGVGDISRPANLLPPSPPPPFLPAMRGSRPQYSVHWTRPRLICLWAVAPSRTVRTTA